MFRLSKEENKKHTRGKQTLNGNDKEEVDEGVHNSQVINFYDNHIL